MPELPGAVVLRPVVVDVPIFMVPSMSSKSNAGAVMAVCAIVAVAQVSSRVGTLGLPCVLLGPVVATFVGLVVSPPESVPERLDTIIPQLVNIGGVVQWRKNELVSSPLKVKLMSPILWVHMVRSRPSRLWDKTSFRLLLDLMVQVILQELVVCVLFLTQVHRCLDAVLKAVVNAAVASPSRGKGLQGVCVVRFVTLSRILVGIDDVGLQGMCINEQWVFQWGSVEVSAHEPFARAKAGQVLADIVSPWLLVDARTSIGTDDVKGWDGHVDPFPVLVSVFLCKNCRDVSADEDGCTSLGSFASVGGSRGSLE